jgi:hypothetical protein
MRVSENRGFFFLPKREKVTEGQRILHMRNAYRTLVMNPERKRLIWKTKA